MKGRGPELTKLELHKTLVEKYGVKSILSEYGMTELLSQFYSKGEGRFTNSGTAKVFLREVNDPVSLNSNREFGGVNVIDLANIQSCCFIATDDLARKTSENEFEIIGRLDHSDMRGCNLLFN